MKRTAMHPLKIARMKLGFTQAMLADFAQVSVPTIKRAEAGKALRADMIQLICEYFCTRYNRQVEPEELGLINEDKLKQGNGKAPDTYSENGVSEQETESEEEMNRREAAKKIGAVIGGTLLSKPQDLLTPQSWTRFSTTLQDSSTVENVSHFEKLTEASWHLLKSSELDVLERVLDSYLPKIVMLVQLPSKRQKALASLTSQGYQIRGILASHRLNLDERRAHHEQAVHYSLLAEDSNTQASALIQLASAFQYKNQPTKVYQTYQLVLPFIDQVSPLLASCVYLGLADASAQCEKEQDALRYLTLAREIFPTHPENDPSYLFSDAGFFSLALYEGLTYLGLDQPKKAWDAFAQIEHYPESATPERVRIEIINLQAETAIAWRDLDRFCVRLEKGRNRALALGSEKRYQEAFNAYQHAKYLWHNESRVKKLAELFIG